MNIDDTLTVLFANYYKKMKREGKNYIPDTKVVKIVLLEMYEKFVGDGLIPI